MKPRLHLRVLPIRPHFPISAIRLLTVALVALSIGTAQATVLHRDVEISDGFVTISAAIESSAQAHRAWDVLTDFDGSDGYLPSLDSSYVVDRTDSIWTVQQVFTTKLVFPWTFRTRLVFADDPARTRLRFRQMSGSLHDYAGSWTVSPAASGQGVRLEYEARVRLRQAIPGFVLRFIVRRHLDQTLPAILGVLEDAGSVSEGLAAGSRVASH